MIHIAGGILIAVVILSILPMLFRIISWIVKMLLVIAAVYLAKWAWNSGTADEAVTMLIAMMVDIAILWWLFNALGALIHFLYSKAVGREYSVQKWLVCHREGQ